MNVGALKTEFRRITALGPCLEKVAEPVDIESLGDVPLFKGLQGSKLRLFKAYNHADGSRVLLAHGYNSCKVSKTGRLNKTPVRMEELKRQIGCCQILRDSHFLESKNTLVRHIYEKFIPVKAKGCGNAMQSFLADFTLFEVPARQQ